MDSMKLKLLGELIDHLTSSQGGDLKRLMDESKNPPVMEESPETIVEDKPKGIAVEKVSVMGKPQSFDQKADDAIASFNKKDDSDEGVENMNMGEDEEMTDEELKELLSKLT